ncbi:RhuM family protein [Flavobacterium gilvum]|uniref:Cytochrome C biogenesis protein CycH n=1 Tax=Flavobacterium gilvum TaxID=1492737 RepID=A0AAC9I3I2_9FLAO|nr:RhuM family protein [Flavobacterium gilvum]AOW09619.1 cytochrome C biogenesis protein CycH [Flavobacterium gilvum]KFC58540.1 putative DNA-binding protein [Flavobacterium gilvum]
MVNQIEIYKSLDNKIELNVSLDQGTVWLNRQQISILFDRDIKTIGKHVNNVFEEGELDKKSVVANFATTATDGKTYHVDFYNLDVIISVGYRVKSKQGTQFRQWATQRLNDYLVKGYAINEKRLKEAENKFQELKQAVSLLESIATTKAITGDEAQGLLKVLGDYAFALDVLDQYDHQTLKIVESDNREVFRISYTEAKKAIEGLKIKFGGSQLFGNEKDDSFKGSLETIYQTFDGKELYTTIEEKAAHLLYFVTKNHSFSDGNKRIAAFLFVWFLDRNALLYYLGNKVIDDNALVALTLMIAESKSDDKDMMVKVVVNLINNRKVQS